MRKLSEIKGEEAIDVLADILGPITEIAGDAEVKAGLETNVAKCVSIALKKYKKEVLEILAAINGKSVEETCKEIDVLSLPTYLIEVVEEPAIQSLFS